MENRRREEVPLNVPNAEGTVWPKQVCPALSQEPIHRTVYDSAGTAGTPTFIWAGPARWMWAYAAGRRNFWIEWNDR